jgi:hypothetical protein
MPLGPWMPPFPCLLSSCFACASRTLTFSLPGFVWSCLVLSPLPHLNNIRTVCTCLQTTFNRSIQSPPRLLLHHFTLERYLQTPISTICITLYGRPSFFGCSSFTRVLLDFGYPRFEPHFLLSFRLFGLHIHPLRAIQPQTTSYKSNKTVVVPSLRRSQPGPITLSVSTFNLLSLPHTNPPPPLFPSYYILSRHLRSLRVRTRSH